MSENTILFLCIGGVIVGAAGIVALANFLDARANQRRANRMFKDMQEGKYDKNKKYFGDQGGWEPDEYTDTTNAPPK